DNGLHSRNRWRLPATRSLPLRLRGCLDSLAQCAEMCRQLDSACQSYTRFDPFAALTHAGQKKHRLLYSRLLYSRLLSSRFSDKVIRWPGSRANKAQIGARSLQVGNIRYCSVDGATRQQTRGADWRGRCQENLDLDVGADGFECLTAQESQFFGLEAQRALPCRLGELRAQVCNPR